METVTFWEPFKKQANNLSNYSILIITPDKGTRNDYIT